MAILTRVPLFVSKGIVGIGILYELVDFKLSSLGSEGLETMEDATDLSEKTGVLNDCSDGGR